MELNEEVYMRMCIDKFSRCIPQGNSYKAGLKTNKQKLDFKQWTRLIYMRYFNI